MGKEKKHKSEKSAQSSAKSPGSKKHHKHGKDEKKKEKKNKSDSHSKDRKRKRKSEDVETAQEAARVTEGISAEDFFRLSEEFRVWLHFSKKRPLEEMTSDEAREVFEVFVSLWNDRKLSMMYYDGIPSEIREACIKTKHKWGIKLSEEEKTALVDTTEEVERKTRRRTEGAWTHMAPPISMAGKICMPVAKPFSGAGVFPSAIIVHDREASRDVEHAKAKALRHFHGDYLDEVAPKETGHAAIMDKRKGAASTLHASAAAKEMSRDGLDLSEAETFGGGDDFSSVRDRINRGKDFRENKRMSRLKDLQDKESTRTSHALGQLGIDLLKKGEKITIPPRND